MQHDTQNPHAGLPFDDDDETIAAALEDVSIPTLLCSLVHITGDASWIRGDIGPAGLMINEYQGFMDEEAKAEARRRALPAIAAFRDAGCVLPDPPGQDLLAEMMDFLACDTVPEDAVPFFLDELQLDGADAGAVDWGDEVSDEARADAHVVVIGCGQSGLLAGIRLAQAGLPFTIIEKNAGPGGTWWDNTYPGARVDVGSHFYCYSFEPADHWTEYFSRQPELQTYFQNVMEKYGIDRHCRFETEVLAATWGEDSARWSVTIRSADGGEETLDAMAVISAVGSLNQPKTPDFAGMDDFAGPSFHSARWDHSVDHRGRKVALIGAGATGFQIAPTIADDVAQLTVFQRTAQWMFPNPNYHRLVPDGDKWAMRHLPFYGRWFRFLTMFPGSGIRIDYSRVDPDWDDSDGRAVSATNEATRGWFTNWLTEQVGDDPDLLAKVIPDYPATGKRTLQDNGSWLQCLKRANVELVRTSIERIVDNGVITSDGEFYEADIICYATGFRHNDYLWPMTITGRGGRVLAEVWGEEPSAYLGITVPEFPNLFCMYGPGTNLVHGGSLIIHSECQISHIIDALHHLLAGGHRAMEPRLDVHDEYRDRLQAEIAQMVWAHWSIKHSHYKNSDGLVYTVSPWPIPDYWRWTKRVEPDDYEFV